MKKNSTSLFPTIFSAKKESSNLLPTVATTNAHGQQHANIRRHITGLKRHYSKREMEKQVTRLLSVNYLQMIPRTPKSVRDEQDLARRTSTRAW